MKNFNIYKGNRSFVKEFTVVGNLSAKKVQKEALKQNILIDRPINDKSDKLLLLAFTEKRSKDDIDKLLKFLENIDE